MKKKPNGLKELSPFEKFEEAVKKILAVPKEEVEKRMEECKQERQTRKRSTKTD
jgi:hypothetical protein